MAAAREGPLIPDQQVLSATRTALQEWSRGGAVGGGGGGGGGSRKQGFVIVETAGGVASPGPSGTLQVRGVTLGSKEVICRARVKGLCVMDGDLSTGCEHWGA